MMKKHGRIKILIGLLMLAGTCSFGYAYVDRQLNATGGTLTLLDRDSSSTGAGNRFVLGEYEGNEVVFELIKDDIAMVSGDFVRLGLCANNCPVGQGLIINYSDTTMYYVETEINNSMSSIAKSALTRNAFIPTESEIMDGGTFGFTSMHRVNLNVPQYLGNVPNAVFSWHGIQMTKEWSVDYAFVKDSTYDIDANFVTAYYSSDGIVHSKQPHIRTGSGPLIAYLIRPALILDHSKVAFAVAGTPSSLSAIDNKNTNVVLKLRISDPSISAPSITETAKKSYAKGDEIEVKYSGAIPGKNISALLYNTKTNEFSYYQSFPNQPASGTLKIKTDQFNIGDQYSIQLVNESVSNDNQPVGASSFSQSFEVEIVQQHKLAYTKQLGSGASTGIDYEYKKNVNEGDTVGRITVNPLGAVPLTYKIESNGGDNTYQNFEIDGLDANNASSAASLNVKIKVGGPNIYEGGLKVGEYKFCISAQDSNENPDVPNTSDQTKVCTTFKVEKPKLTITFDDKNTTKKTVTEAATNWNETATVTPTPTPKDVKVTYTKVGGDIGLIDINPDTGEITYTGNVTFGKVKIRATADDKDKDQGVDNYDEVYTDKEIIIAQDLEGVITPDTNSSDPNIPTFTATDTNVQTGGTIGKVQGTQGTPDNLKSGTITYTYGLKSDGDGSLFSVNASTGEIKSNADLSTGVYNITVTITDKWNPKPKDIPVTINVGVAAAEELKFYSDKNAITVINQKKVKYTDKNVFVFATVKGSTNTNTVKYKIKDGSNTVITVNEISGVVTIKGVGKVTIVAEKEGASGQAKASTELEFIVEASEQEDFIYTTDSTLSTERPKKGDKYTTLKETYAPNKTFYVYTKGNPTGSTVTYQLKAGSPTDVITVDPDGKIHILNASLPTQIGKVIVEAISHDPSGNYNDKTIELPIDIEKGERKVTFKEDPINVVSGKGSVTPEILTDDKPDTFANGDLSIEVDPKESAVAWTNDGETIQYDWTDKAGKDVEITVTKAADRNYKAATGTGTLHILGADENVLTVTTPGKVIYGDHFAIRSTQDDSMSTNVQYTFTTDNGVYISAPQVNGKVAEFDALRYSGSTEITITITRTADGELPLTKKVKIKVLPKPIEIEIEDKEKERLEDNPELTYKDFKDKLVTWNGVRDTINESVIKLSTTAGKYSPVGTYPISAKNAQKQLNDNYPNYTFTIKEGKLNIKDNGDKNFWDTDDDGCPDLNIELTDDNGDTILINGDKNEDGIPDYNIDTNGDGKPDLNIDTDNDGKPDLNLVQLKSWKPSRCVTVNGVDYASGISAKPEINIDLDGDGIPDINIDNKGDFKPHINISKDGKTPEVNLVTIDVWKPDKDYQNGKLLYDTMVIEPLINIDTNGDDCPDINIDVDGDGNPDLNIDVDGDGIPDTNIDSTADGKADTNLDTDGDGVADENIVDISEWKPDTKVGQTCTMILNPEDPDDSDNSTNDNDPSGKPNGEVQGSYYPGDNVGGALTGDSSNPLLYMGIGFSSLSILLFIMYKRKKDNI